MYGKIHGQRLLCLHTQYCHALINALIEVHTDKVQYMRVSIAASYLKTTAEKQFNDALAAELNRLCTEQKARKQYFAPRPGNTKRSVLQFWNSCIHLQRPMVPSTTPALEFMRCPVPTVPLKWT